MQKTQSLKNLVVYASESGNTALLANEIFNTIPFSPEGKEIVDVRTWNGTLDADNYFVGFWVNRGSCSLEIIDLLSSLHNKNVALFGTCGLGNSDEYFRSLAQNAKVWLSDDNNFLGYYFCLGSMPEEIKTRYESYRGKYDDQKIDLMLKRYNEARNHPNRLDLIKSHSFTSQCLSKAREVDLTYAAFA